MGKKFKENIVKLSASNDYEIAKNEWKYCGKIDTYGTVNVCICLHKIKYEYLIRNIYNRNIVIVGGTCRRNFKENRNLFTINKNFFDKIKKENDHNFDLHSFSQVCKIIYTQIIYERWKNIVNKRMIKRTKIFNNWYTLINSITHYDRAKKRQRKQYIKELLRNKTTEIINKKKYVYEKWYKLIELCIKNDKYKHCFNVKCKYLICGKNNSIFCSVKCFDIAKNRILSDIDKKTQKILDKYNIDKVSTFSEISDILFDVGIEKQKLSINAIMKRKYMQKICRKINNKITIGRDQLKNYIYDKIKKKEINKLTEQSKYILSLKENNKYEIIGNKYN